MSRSAELPAEGEAVEYPGRLGEGGAAGGADHPAISGAAVGERGHGDVADRGIQRRPARTSPDRSPPQAGQKNATTEAETVGLMVMVGRVRIGGVRSREAGESVVFGQGTGAMSPAVIRRVAAF